MLDFKTAMAIGLDALRAFPGIQVVGRILRVHPLLQRRPDVPPVLDYGCVFLANREAQVGLTGAATVINKLKEHTADSTPKPGRLRYD